MNNNNLKVNFKDHSRFNRWVSSLDEKDKPLKTSVRRGKWVLIIMGLFSLFVVSFLMSPNILVQSKSVENPFAGIVTIEQKTSSQSAFELPVDSFKNQLKIRVNENIPEKE